MKKKKSITPSTFNEKTLHDELLHSAKAIGLSVGAAELIIEKIVPKVAERMAKRAIVTADDLNRFIATEAEKYNKDLAYVYKIRGKII